MGEGGEGFFTEWEDSYDSFDQMNLHENLLRGIYAYGEAIWQYCTRPAAWIPLFEQSLVEDEDLGPTSLFIVFCAQVSRSLQPSSRRALSPLPKAWM